MRYLSYVMEIGDDRATKHRMKMHHKLNSIMMVNSCNVETGEAEVGVSSWISFNCVTSSTSGHAS